jgi:Cytochrome C oxidase, cbb3-type, subunit III
LALYRAGFTGLGHHFSKLLMRRRTEANLGARSTFLVFAPRPSAVGLGETGEWEGIMKRLVLEGLAVSILVVGFNLQSRAQQPVPQQPDIGKIEYQSSCAACHGADGKGTGPVAAALSTKPADLTTLAKRNNGVFPFGRIYDTIDGRVEVGSHGTRDMPVWGFRFSPAPIPGFSPQAPYFLDPLYDREPVIRSRILAVIDYLYRIQEK